MAKLAIHPVTERQLKTFAAAPGHAVLLYGPDGSGKRSLARQLAETVLETGDLNNYPYKLLLAPADGKTIGIEAVRQLEQFLSLKVPGNRRHDRVVIIEDAQSLSLEAQNALLKNLEEPPAGSLIVLIAAHPQALLPTIRSRLQMIAVTRPGKASLESAFKEYGAATFGQAYNISGGRPGLLSELLTDEDHPLTLATAKARQLLGQTAYERLQQVDELSKQRQLAADTAYILQQMAHLSLQTATGPAAQRWQRILEAAYHAAEALERNAQPKLALTDLMLNL